MRAAWKAGFWLCACFAASSPARASAPELDFRPPATVSDPSTPAVMRDLAERLLPVYQDLDSDRYLANLSALQLVAGNYAAAFVSRQSLRDRRRRADSSRPISRSVIYDIYAYAKATETDTKVSFAQAFTKAYRDFVPRLGDLDAYVLTKWFETPLSVLRDNLQKAFDQQRAQDSISQSDAVQLLWTYLTYDAFRNFGPLVDLLDAADDRARYSADNEILIKTADGATISAVLVRPNGPAKPLPALLQFTIDDSQNYAKECAAHGYVGVVAYPRGNGKSGDQVVPFQKDGEDARAVIEWIAKQPWSDGRVGMFGEGYGAFAAWAAAKRVPPALKAIATSAASAPGIDVPMTGNIFQNSAYRWSLCATNSKESVEDSCSDDEVWRALDQKWYRSGKRYRDLGRTHGEPNPIFIRWLNHPSYDLYWQKMIPYREQFAHIGIPVLTMTGYYAASEPGDLYYFTQHIRYDRHADHTLVIGPYDDDTLQRGSAPVLHGYQIDSVAAVDLHELRYQWFDHVLKDAAAPPLLSDHVNYEVMGANEWQHAASVDAMASGSLKLFLGSNPGSGGYPLTPRKPSHPAFVHQTVSLTDRSDAGWMPPTELISKSLAVQNGVMFESEPLTKATEVSGLLSGRLDLTVNKMDVDLNIILYERLAQGDYVRLFSPTYEFRASYARDRVHRHLLEAGVRQVLAFKSERMTSRQLQAGSRLVMVLAVNKRPDREINYGTGNDVSEESIADGKIPIKIRWFGDSYIEIPIRKQP
jgi:putative CocE/NonD family hydrolase